MTWERLLQDIEQDPWGKGYRIAMGKLKRNMTPTGNEILQAAETLFPIKPESRWTYVDTQEFTVEELKAASARLCNGLIFD